MIATPHFVDQGGPILDGKGQPLKLAIGKQKH